MQLQDNAPRFSLAPTMSFSVAILAKKLISISEVNHNSTCSVVLVIAG